MQGLANAKGLKIQSFTDRETFLNQYRVQARQDYCFAFEFSRVRPGIKEVNITYMFPYDASLNTFEPLYEFSNSVPNWSAWNNTFIFGTP